MITKFSYLKEFVDLNMRNTIDGLPFTVERYNRAKSILMDCYGKESEIVKGYVQNILVLPRIKETNPQKSISFTNNWGTLYNHWKQRESWEISEEMWH